MTKSTEHNSKLCAEFIARSKVFSRYPRASEQAESLPFGSGLPKFAYNNSVLGQDGKILMTYRYHFADDYRTKLGMATIVNSKIEKAVDLPIDGISTEDARLFSLHGEPWMSWVDSNFLGQKDPKCCVKYAQLDSYLDPLEPDEAIRRGQVEKGFKVDRIFQVKAGGNDMTSMQKNWCFFESDENLFAIFETWPEQIVFQIKGDVVINEYRTPTTMWPYGIIRGGNIVPYDGKLLRFFHSSTDYGIGRPEKRYYVGALLMERRPPFTVLAVSKKPILYGSEIDNLTSADRKACRHWKATVVFPCGAVVAKDTFILAAGINDASCALLRIKPEMLNL